MCTNKLILTHQSLYEYHSDKEVNCLLFLNIVLMPPIVILVLRRHYFMFNALKIIIINILK